MITYQNILSNGNWIANSVTLTKRFGSIAISTFYCYLLKKADECGKKTFTLSRDQVMESTGLTKAETIMAKKHLEEIKFISVKNVGKPGVPQYTMLDAESRIKDTNCDIAKSDNRKKNKANLSRPKIGTANDLSRPNFGTDNRSYKEYLVSNTLSNNKRDESEKNEVAIAKAIQSESVTAVFDCVKSLLDGDADLPMFYHKINAKYPDRKIWQNGAPTEYGLKIMEVAIQEAIAYYFASKQPTVGISWLTFKSALLRILAWHRPVPEAPQVATEQIPATPDGEAYKKYLSWVEKSFPVIWKDKAYFTFKGYVKYRSQETVKNQKQYFPKEICQQLMVEVHNELAANDFQRKNGVDANYLAKLQKEKNA